MEDDDEPEDWKLITHTFIVPPRRAATLRDRHTASRISRVEVRDGGLLLIIRPTRRVRYIVRMHDYETPYVGMNQRRYHVGLPPLGPNGEPLELLHWLMLKKD